MKGNLAMQPEIQLARSDLITLFKAGVEAADPKLCVSDYLSTLVTADPSRFQKTTVISLGKAACSMMSGALSILPKPNVINEPLAITNNDNVIDLPGVSVMAAGHPIPNEDGLVATEKVVEAVTNLTADDTLLVLISGGASAMFTLPAEGISLTDKIKTTQSLLDGGIDINRMNVVRKQLSAVKGGKLAQIASPAHVVGLILSDVIGDDLSAIASGPTVFCNENKTDAINILKSTNTWSQLTTPVIQHLQSLANPAQGLSKEYFEKSVNNHLIGSNHLSLTAVVNAASELDIDIKALEEPICGEAKDAAESLAILAGELLGKKSNDAPLLIVGGGETTVTIQGKGKGGRNQEFALAFALACERNNIPPRWLFLSAGTDGRDGPTDAAGGLVDPDSLARMNENGINPNHALLDNDAYHALKASNDLLITGSTGTNVADLQLLMLY